MTDRHLEFLDLVKARSIKRTGFNYGLLTADRYVKTLQECVGSDRCYQYAARGTTSFQDILEKSARTVTYNNREMITKDIYGAGTLDDLVDDNGDEIVLPKHTLMVFQHVLTTTRKDRDNDILRTDGALVDPKMLLLWQHVHTLPIGKLLKVVDHTLKSISVISCIVDMNDLCHDAAVMVENGMGRFSHGFRALEFTKSKEIEGDPTSGGFDVTEFEIMEESLVSVPSNPDSETEEILLSLVEGNKLRSGMMKSVGRGIRQRRPLAVTIEKAVPNGKPTCGCGGHAKGGACGCNTGANKAARPGRGQPASEKAKIRDDEAKGTENQEMICPQCGEIIDESGICDKCGYLPKNPKIQTKSCPACGGQVEDGICTECGARSKSISVQEAMAAFLAKAESTDRHLMLKALECFRAADDTHRLHQEILDHLT